MGDVDDPGFLIDGQDHPFHHSDVMILDSEIGCKSND